MSSLQDLKSQLNEYIKTDRFDKIWSSSVKEGFINTGYNQIQKDGQYNWNENQTSGLIPMTSGTSEYDLPDRFVRLDLVQINSNRQPLRKTNFMDYRLRNATGTGFPSMYYIYGNKIGLEITPNGDSLFLIYRKKLATLTDSQDSELPEDFDDAIVMYAAYKLWSTTKNTAKAAQALQDYREALNRLRMQYLLQDSADLIFRDVRAYNSRPPNAYKAIY